MVDEHSVALGATDPIRELAGIVLAELSFVGVLQRATHVVKRAIPGAAEVSVTMQNGQPTTVAASGQLAVDVDESQYDAGYGPCLDAIRLAQTVVVKDQTAEVRWPEYSPRAVEAGIGSSVSVPLALDGPPIGAFNIYGRAPHAFSDEAVKAAEDLAVFASAVLSNAGLYFTASARAEQMTEAMRSRAVIEQAKGILMGSRHCDADEAFALLVELSQKTHRKLHVVAQALVDNAAADDG